MKPLFVLVPLGLLAASPALAQPTLPPADRPNSLPGDPDEPQPVAVTTTPSDPPPQPQPVVVAPAQTQPEPAAQRPTAFAIALGLGYVIPSDLSTPNTTSARLRLASGLTFEPQVTLGTESQKQNNDIVETELSINSVALALIVRYPLRSHGKVDLSLIGGAAVSLTTVNPEGDDNNRKINSFGLSWGVALDYWVTNHWNVSFTASNPILLTRSITEDQGPGVEVSDSLTSFGAIFDPTLAVMLHLYL